MHLLLFLVKQVVCALTHGVDFSLALISAREFNME